MIQDSIWGVTVTNGGNNKNGYAALGPYAADNSGPLGGVYPLPVIVPPRTSLAIDYLGSLSPTTDERGFLRGGNVNGNSKKTFDIGAVEYEPNTQAETMQSNSHSVSLVVVSGSGYSNGKGAELQAKAIGDNVIYYDATVTYAANYQYVARFATGPSEGLVQLEWSTNIPGVATCFGKSQDGKTSAPITAIGIPTELYSKTAGFITVNYPGTYAEVDDYENCLRFRVTGRNKSSSGYAVYIDYINTLPL